MIFQALRYTASLALDVVEALACSLSCERSVDRLCEEAKAAHRLVDKEAEYEVSEPPDTSAAGVAPTPQQISPEPPSPDVEAPGIQLTHSELLDAEYAVRFYARTHSTRYGIDWTGLGDKLRAAADAVK